MTPRRSAEAGFTLVEVMVALMIFGMIASAGVAILSFSIRAQAATGERLDDGAALARTFSILSADLAQATARIARDETGLPRPSFIGEATTLQLVRGGWGNIDAAPRASEQKVGWQLDGSNLVRIGYPRIDGAAAQPATPMLTDVRALVMRYRFAGAWSDRWDGANGIALPQAMELRLDRADGRQYRAMFLVGTGYVADVPGQQGQGGQPGQAGNAN